MKLAIFLAPGYEEGEAVITIDILRRAGVSIDVIGVNQEKEVKSSHNLVIKADYLISEIKYDHYQGFILPGGLTGVDNLLKSDKLLSMLKEGYKDKKILAAICAAPQIFGQLGFLNGLEITGYPGCNNGLEKSHYNSKKPVLVNDNIITGASVGCVIWFALAIVKNILGSDHAKKIEETLVIRNCACDNK